MLNLIIEVLLAGLLIYVVYWVLGMLALPPQVKQVIMVIIAIIALIWIAQLLLGGAAGAPALR